MKEVMAIIRQNKVNATKDALANAGFPAFTCRKVMGRGKNSVDPALLQTILKQGTLPLSALGEQLSETMRLIPKRIFTLIVEEEDVEKVVKTFIEVNSTGNVGDGKIFILPIYEAYTIRSGEMTQDAY